MIHWQPSMKIQSQMAKGRRQQQFFPLSGWEDSLESCTNDVSTEHFSTLFYSFFICTNENIVSCCRIQPSVVGTRKRNIDARGVETSSTSSQHGELWSIVHIFDAHNIHIHIWESMGMSLKKATEATGGVGQAESAQGKDVLLCQGKSMHASSYFIGIYMYAIELN